jgi:DNA-binding transcriptional LysR family regulator
LGLATPDNSKPACAALADMVRQRPGLRITLRLGTSDVLDEAVDCGELDLAVASAYPGHEYRCERILLGEDRVQIAARADHPLAGPTPRAIEELEPYGWVMPDRRSASRRLVTRMLERAGIATPTVVVEAQYVSTATLNIVATTDLLIAAPSAVLAQWAGRVHALSLPALDFERQQVLLVRPGVRWSPIMSAFREIVQGQRRRSRSKRSAGP